MTNWKARGLSKCRAWAGTGTLFASRGGLPSSIRRDSALAAPLSNASPRPFVFFRASDIRIDFNKPQSAGRPGEFKEVNTKAEPFSARSDFVIRMAACSELSLGYGPDDDVNMLKPAGLPEFSNANVHLWLA